MTTYYGGQYHLSPSDLPDMGYETVRCAWCGVRVREPNAIMDKRGGSYCSATCMDDDAADRAASQADSAEDA